MAVSSQSRPPVSPLVSWDKAQPQPKQGAKKSNPLLVVILIAVVLLAVVGAVRMFNKPSKGQWVQVMAAKTDIQVGSHLCITNIRFLDVPKQYFAPDMMISLNDISGRTSRTFIPVGEPIMSYMLLPGRRGLAGSLATDERAITLQLEDDALVDHAIMPDDRIDLLVVSNKDDKKFTKTIAQAIRVLLACPKDQLAARRGGIASNKITLAVTAQQAEIINEAASAGSKLRAVLRSPVSISNQKLDGAGPEDLIPALAQEKIAVNNVEPSHAPIPPPPNFDSTEAPIAEQQNPVQWMVEVISGNHRETYAVPSK